MEKIHSKLCGPGHFGDDNHIFISLSLAYPAAPDDLSA
jgi:hypothetical protein